MSGAIIVRVVRALMHGGRRVEAGETLKVPALVAAELLASGRAELVHGDDADEVHKARQADVRRAIAAAGKPWHEPRVSEPWQRIA